MSYKCYGVAEQSVQVCEQSEEDTDYLQDVVSIFALDPACNALAFIADLGGEAEYDKALGILTCTLNGKKYKFTDFSNEVQSDNKTIYLKEAMRRMQGDVPYLTLQDMRILFGFELKVEQKRHFRTEDEGKMIKTKTLSSVKISFHP